MRTASSIPLDLLALSIDLISLLCLSLVGLVGLKAVRSFRQSRQAVIESASLLSVIVDALTSRIQRSESALATLRSEITTALRQGHTLRADQANLHTSYEQVAHQLREALSNDKKLMSDLEQVKVKLSELAQGKQTIEGLPRREHFATVPSEGDILATLTPTEHRTLEILRTEGSKAAPELGKRLKKSREHTARLMKKLYMEGYVSRESNHTPFRYRLSDEVRSALESAGSQITAERPEMP